MMSHSKSGLTTPFLKEQATGNSAPSVDAGGWAQQATGNWEQETGNRQQGTGEEKYRKLIKGVLDPILSRRH
ncbi:MAG: hypothetical protein AB4426_09445 [Xenococcaceae cyanobacterium]